MEEHDLEQSEGCLNNNLPIVKRKDLPSIDFRENLCLCWIIISHKFSIFYLESIPPKCKMANSGFPCNRNEACERC